MKVLSNINTYDHSQNNSTDTSINNVTNIKNFNNVNRGNQKLNSDINPVVNGEINIAED